MEATEPPASSSNREVVLNHFYDIRKIKKSEE